MILGMILYVNVYSFVIVE